MGDVDLVEVLSLQLSPTDLQSLMIEVYRRAGEEGQHGTDSAGLYERYGIPVRLVEICDPNLKLTSRSDFAIVEALLISRQEGAGR